MDDLHLLVDANQKLKVDEEKAGTAGTAGTANDDLAIP